MRNRTWSDVVMSLMIALCVALVAKPEGAGAPAAKAASPAEVQNVAASAQSLAVAVLFATPGARTDAVRSDRLLAHVAAQPSATDRAMSNAAEAAGNVAREIEMPFFSFGGDASAE